ncbi:MAG: TRAP transporter substrate-binding protein [Alphaproteobacteria bacterium]
MTKPTTDRTEAGRTRSRRDALKIGGAAAAASFYPFHIAKAQSTTLRFAHSAPEAHGWHIWAVAFKEAMESATEGEVAVRIFPNAQMGAERDSAQAVRIGSVDMAAIGVALMNWVPEMSITDAPFLWQSRQQAYNAIAGEFGDRLRGLSSDKGFRLAGWTDLGFRCMTNNKHPISSVADMADLKMRVPNSKAYIGMMQALGSTTVAVTLSELYLALSQGVADGQDTPPSVVKSNKFYEVQKFVSPTNHILTTAYVVANPDSYEKLGADQKAAFDAASAAADEHLRAHTRADEASAYDFLAGEGMEVNTEVDISSFREACASVLTDYPDLFQPELVELARNTPV